jgi:hypothetical protein
MEITVPKKTLREENWLPPWLATSYQGCCGIGPAEQHIKSIAEVMLEIAAHRRNNRRQQRCHRCDKIPDVVCYKPFSGRVWCEYCWSPELAAAAGYADPASKETSLAVPEPSGGPTEPR